jgi:small subunit ribosomal protein S18e
MAIFIFSFCKPSMSLYLTEDAQIQDIIRMFNTNINGREKVIKALTVVKGVGMRMSEMLCKRAKIDTTLRAGEVPAEQMEMIAKILEAPMQHNIPEWFLNHQRDLADGNSYHLIGNQLEADFRLYLERAKRVRHIRGLRLLRGLKVHGQRTKSNGRRGKTMGVSKKK